MKRICKYLDFHHCAGMVVILAYILCNATWIKAQSCRAAGYTECCTQDKDPNSCEGRPLGICYCDPSCHEYGDCCEDIMKICHPEKDALLAQIKPLVVYVTDITYQSAIVHWITPVFYNDLNTTLQYTMEYSTALQNANTSATSHNTSIKVVSLSVNSSSDTLQTQEQYTIRLTGLQNDTAYNFTLTAQTRFGILDLDSGGTFTTLDPDLLCVENVHVEIVNTTAVQVFWSSLSLLPGVTISHYTIHYQETNDKLPQRQANSSLVNSSVNCHTTIGGLNEGIWYSFVVIATLTEEGGRNIDIGSCSERIDVFLPATRLFQLTAVGIFSSPCSLWGMEEERLLINIFRTNVLRALEDFCNCNYTGNHVSKDRVICHSTTSTSRTLVQDASDHMTTYHVTYRGILWSTPGSTTDDLIGCIERWVSSDPVIGLKPAEMVKANTPSGTTPLFSLDMDCPVRIRLNSQPLCDFTDSSIDIPTVPLIGTQVMEGDSDVRITLPIFVASLVAMFLFLLVIMMVGVICMLLITQTRKHKVSVTDEVGQRQSQQEHTQPLHNVYTPSPHTSETMATISAVHTYSRPLAIRVTESSESGPIFPVSALPARNDGSEGTSENEAQTAVDGQDSSIANEPARVFTGDATVRRLSSDSLASLDYGTDNKEEKELDESMETIAISTTV